jgi:hypothetical protein
MTTPFKHENIITIAGVLGAQPELRLTSGGNAVATLIVYTNYILRNEDGSTRQEVDCRRDRDHMHRPRPPQAPVAANAETDPTSQEGSGGTKRP